MKKYKTGLALGKFAPLHKGHEYLIKTASDECEKLYIMVYEDDCIDIPATIRGGWIKTLFPESHVIICQDGPQETGYTERIIKLQNQYISSVLFKEDIDRIDAFYSSEKYGDHVSKHLNCVDRRVDEARTIIPVSATMIRTDLYKHRDFLDSVVYRDYITKIVFLGGESTGKSTLTKELAKAFHTCRMAEYGDEYWFQNNIDGKLSPKQLLEIAIGHNKCEDDLLMSCNRYMFVDTNNLTTYYYSMDYSGIAIPELEDMAKTCFDRYDIVILCGDDIPYDDTPDRRGEEQRRISQQRYIFDLTKAGIKYYVAKGTVEERVKFVSNILENYTKDFGV